MSFKEAEVIVGSGVNSLEQKLQQLTDERRQAFKVINRAQNRSVRSTPLSRLGYGIAMRFSPEWAARTFSFEHSLDHYDQIGEEVAAYASEIKSLRRLPQIKANGDASTGGKILASAMRGGKNRFTSSQW